MESDKRVEPVAAATRDVRLDLKVSCPLLSISVGLPFFPPPQVPLARMLEGRRRGHVPPGLSEDILCKGKSAAAVLVTSSLIVCLSREIKASR